MRLLPDHFYEQLEHYRAHRAGQIKDRLPSPVPSADEQEFEPLVTLARSLQRATPMQVDAGFADLLEEQLLASAAQQIQLGQTRKQEHRDRGYWIAPIKPAMTRTRAALVACLCLLVLCLGAGALVMRSLPLPQKTVSVTANQVELTEQEVRTQLHMLASLADPAHAQIYRQELTKLDQQIIACAQEVEAVPAGSAGQRAAQELTEVKTDTRKMLYQFLLGLALPERVLTTTELGNVGATVPVVQSALFTLTTSKSQAVVVLRGSGILPGAHLFIDNQELSVNGVLQNGGYAITIPWSAQLPTPQYLGILNQDHTAAQTAVLTITTQNSSTPTPSGDDGGHRGGRDGSGGGGRDG